MVNEHGFLDCATCRQSPPTAVSTTAQASNSANGRAPGSAWRNLWNAVRLFWPDLIALLAIAGCTILLGEMLLDMLRRHL
jgi:hypothetical protein